MRMKSVLWSVLAAVACMSLVPEIAHAEVIKLAPHTRTITTDDGWKVTLRLDDEKWDRVPTTNMTGTSREGYGSLHAEVSVAGGGASLQGAELEVGYIIGCFANLSSVSVSAQANAGFAPEIIVGVPTGVILAPSVGVAPSVGAALAPGETKAYPMEKKSLQGAVTTLRMRETHMSIDGCVGPAQVRAYATVSIDSRTSKDGTTVYGDTFPI